MAKPGNVAVDLTGNQDIDGILWGYKWNTTTLTYSFPTSQFAYSDFFSGYESIQGFQAITSAQATAINQVLQDISGFANLTFVSSTDNHAALRFGNLTARDIGNGLETLNTAYGYTPDPDSYPTYAHGDVWFNTSDYWNPQLGNFAYGAGVMHEIGHVLGLKHGHDPQAAHGVTFPELPADHNSNEYSIMTYWTYPGDTNEWISAPNLPQSYMQDDIAALQHLYGANYNHNSDDTVYFFIKQTGEMLVNNVGTGVPSDNFIFRTIWDGGGTDTYNFTNYTTNLTVDLNPGAWTNLGMQLADLGDGHTARGNIANALLFQGNTASLIENAIGGSGSDTLIGNQAVNRLEGAGGDDTLDGRYGGDTMIGGQGNDIYIVDTLGSFLHLANGGLIWVPGDTVTENANEGTDTVYSSVDYSLPANVEQLLLSGFNNIDGTGNALDNFIWGNNADNVINGGLGADAMQGGRGNDTYIVDNTGDSVFEVPNGGTDTVKTTLTSYTLGANVENVTYTGTGDFVGTGNSLANAITGSGGNDRLDGGIGADTMSGGSGNDTYLVDSAGDVIVDTAGTDTVLAALSTYALPSGLENLFYNGQSNFTGIGNSLANTLRGGNGNDILDGGGGADVMQGGMGNDTYFVDAATDIVLEGRGAGTDTVISTISYVLAAEIENLKLSDAPTRHHSAIDGTGNAVDNVITGSTSDNGLFGLDGNDTLIGREGIDRLDGGMGSDILTGDFETQSRSPDPFPRTDGGQTAPNGSAYNDVFVFHLGEASGDVVTDFYGAGKINGDHLEFSGYGAGTIAHVGNTDYYTITPDAAHGGAAAAETIELIGVLNLNTSAGSNDFLFV
jgi:serralysin